MAVLANRVKMSTSTIGTGTLDLDAAETGYQSFADGGITNGQVVSYAIEDGAAWEIGTGTYTTGTPDTLSRTVIESSNSDAEISLTGNAVVFITALSGDLQNAVDMDQGVATTDSPAFAGLSVNSNPIATAGSLSNRNKIINGAMVIDQRNAGAAVTPTGSVYLLDRWAASLSQSSKLTFQQSTDAPVGFKNSLKVTVASSFTPAAGDFFNVAQVVEGNNVADLEWGTADALTATVSFYAKVSVAGSYAVTVWSGNGDRNYTTDVALTTSWTKYSIVVTGLTSGTVDVNNGAALRIAFDLGSGSDFQTTAGSWQTGSFDINTASSTKFVSQSSGATFYITGVQLEVGDTATPFEHRSFGQELELCQRYYFKTFPQGTAPAQNVGSSNGALFGGSSVSNVSFVATQKFPTTMRAAPTVTTFSPGAASANWQDQSGSIPTAVVLNAGDSQVSVSGTTNTAVGGAHSIHLTASSEL